MSIFSGLVNDLRLIAINGIEFAEHEGAEAVLKIEAGAIIVRKDFEALSAATKAALSAFVEEVHKDWIVRPAAPSPSSPPQNVDAPAQVAS